MQWKQFTMRELIFIGRSGNTVIVQGESEKLNDIFLEACLIAACMAPVGFFYWVQENQQALLEKPRWNYCHKFWFFSWCKNLNLDWGGFITNVFLAWINSINFRWQAPGFYSSSPAPLSQYVESTICYWFAFGSGDLIKDLRKGFYLSLWHLSVFCLKENQLHCHIENNLDNLRIKAAVFILVD